MTHMPYFQGKNTVLFCFGVSIPTLSYTGIPPIGMNMMLSFVRLKVERILGPGASGSTVLS